MKQRPMSIYDFKRGDIITRIQPSKPLPGFDGDDFRDRAYIGTAMKFLGVVNGCVYVERYEKPSENSEDELPTIGSFFKMMMRGDGPINLPLDIWDEGWSYYIDPYTLKAETPDEEPNMTKAELEREIRKAVEREDFVYADKLQKRLNNL